MQIRVLVLCVGLVIAAVMVARADRYEEPPMRTAFAAFPMQFGEWSGYQQPPFSKRALEVLGLDDYLTRAYVGPDRNGFDLYVGYWKSQRQGDTIHSPQNCLPGAGWEPISQSIITMPNPRNPNGPALTLNRYVVQKGLQKDLVLYWYQSHGRIVASEYWSRFYLVMDAARFNRSDGAVVRVIRPIPAETPDATEQAERDALRFIKDLLPQLDGFLPV